MVVVVPKERAGEAVAVLKGQGEKVFTVGELARRDKKRRRIREDDHVNGEGTEKKRRRKDMTEAAASTPVASVPAPTSYSNDNVEENGDEGCVLLNVSSWNWD